MGEQQATRLFSHFFSGNLGYSTVGVGRAEATSKREKKTCSMKYEHGRSDVFFFTFSRSLRASFAWDIRHPGFTEITLSPDIQKHPEETPSVTALSGVVAA